MTAKTEQFEFFEALRRGDPQLRVLEAEEAAEGVPLIPQAAYDQILSMKPEKSLIDRLGIERWACGRRIANIPVEVVGGGGMVLPAAILEQAAHIANEPAFALRAITLIKYGSMVTATEELLDDQKLFQSWFPGAVARRMALQENTILNTRLTAGGTVGVHLAAAHTLTEAQLMTAWQVMPDPWREGAKALMNQLTAQAIHSLLIATPRAFAPSISFEWKASGGDFMGMPLVQSSHITPVTTALDTIPVIFFINPDGVKFVHNSGIQILRDDYGDAVNGRVRFFSSQRFNIVIGDPLSVVRVEDHAP
jgi:HK97 family phage major capsid protein